jgi:opacity protein-like surface antigen/outer membrane receptor protein involved in Fe transport
MGGAALFALGIAIRAHAQEAPSAPQQPAEQQQQRPAAQPAPPDQPPAQQVPAQSQPSAPSLPEVTVSPAKPTPKPAAVERRVAPATGAPPAQVAPRRTPTLPTTPAAPTSAPGPSSPAAVLDQKMQVMDQARENLLPKLGATSDTIDRAAIEALPQGDNTPIDKAILQLPGVSYDSAVANPNFHIRNEYANVQYRINGILLPEGVSGLGTVIDTNFISRMSLLTGTLPAQYGLRTSGVFDITSRTFAEPTGTISYYGGSRETMTPSFDFGGSAGNTQYFVTARGNWNSLGIENTTDQLNAIHDHTDQGKFFGYTSTLLNDSTRLTLMSGAGYSKFQIPNNPGQIPLGDFGPAIYNSANLNENEYDTYAYQLAALQTKGEQIDTQLAGFFRYAKIHFVPDIYGDLVFNDVASDVIRESYLGGIQFDAAWRANDMHTLRTGFAVSSEQTNVTNTSNVLPVDPTTGAIAPTPFPITDATSRLGWNIGTYLQDEWKLTNTLTFNLGVRFDQLYQFIEASQVSPRAAFVLKPVEGTTFHAGYARYFTPPMQAQATQSNLALFTNTTNQPDLPYNSPVLPERSNYFDVGVDQKVLPGLDVGVDFYYKMAKDMIDDGQFGQAVVLTQFNWTQGYSEGAEFKVKYQSGNFKAYANFAYGTMRAVGPISNQYLLDPAEYAYLLNNYHFTDDMQMMTGSAGASYKLDNTLFSFSMIYGSGLRSEFVNLDHGAPYASVNLGIAHEFRLAPGEAPLTARFDIVNLFDQAYELRNGTGIGVFAPQFGARRGYYFGLSQKFGPGARTDKPGSAALASSSGYGTTASATAAHMRPLISKDSIEAVWTWSGLYMGGNVGFAAARFNTDALYSDSSVGTPLLATSSSIRHDGWLGGGQAGYNWQWGRWLAGVEADVQFAHQRTLTASLCPGAVCNPAIAGDAPETLTHEHNLDWFGTVRARLGAVFAPDAVAYVTGGVAYGVIEHQGSIYGFANGLDANGNPAVVFAGTDFFDRMMKVGWTAGVGIEAHLGGPWTARVEYLHIDFGAESTTEFNTQNSTPTAITFNSRITENLVRLGINYKFDPYAGYAAPDQAAQPASARPGRPRRDYTATVPPPWLPWVVPWTWAGFHLGANVGYGMARSKTDALFSDDTGTNLFAASSTDTANGVLVGAQSGADWQLGSFVAGIETDVTFVDRGASPIMVCPTACNAFGPVVASLDQGFQMQWFATLRGRFGVTVTPDALLYVTGGAAFAEFVPAGTGLSFDDSGNPAIIPFYTDHPKLGWTAGAGIEAHLGGPWTARVEYLHLDFGTVFAPTINDQGSPLIHADFSSRITQDIVRAGLNYKFTFR